MWRVRPQEGRLSVNMDNRGRERVQSFDASTQVGKSRASSKSSRTSRSDRGEKSKSDDKNRGKESRKEHKSRVEEKDKMVRSSGAEAKSDTGMTARSSGVAAKRPLEASTSTGFTPDEKRRLQEPPKKKFSYAQASRGAKALVVFHLDRRRVTSAERE